MPLFAIRPEQFRTVLRQKRSRKKISILRIFLFIPVSNSNSESPSVPFRLLLLGALLSNSLSSLLDFGVTVLESSDFRVLSVRVLVLDLRVKMRAFLVFEPDVRSPEACGEAS